MMSAMGQAPGSSGRRRRGAAAQADRSPRLPPGNPCRTSTISYKSRRVRDRVCVGQWTFLAANDKPAKDTVGNKGSWVRIPPSRRRSEAISRRRERPFRSCTAASVQQRISPASPEDGAGRPTKQPRTLGLPTPTVIGSAWPRMPLRSAARPKVRAFEHSDQTRQAPWSRACCQFGWRGFPCSHDRVRYHLA